MNLKTDDLIFLLGVVIIIGLVILKTELSYVTTMASLFGAHKVGSIVDDKFVDRIESPPTQPPEDV